MTDEPKTPQTNIQQGVPYSPVTIQRQYSKDLSFENPNAPEILKKGDNRPEMDMNINLDVQRLESGESEDLYEVSLIVTANAVRNGKAMFVTEVNYAAAVSIEGLEEKKHHPLLFIQVPQLLYPFARQIISDVTQHGGFMPLQLRPVDFRGMYLQEFGNQSPENEPAGENES